MAESTKASSLLWAGLAVFAVGFLITQWPGDFARTLGLCVELVGAAILFVNMARSRRDARAPIDESPPDDREG